MKIRLATERDQELIEQYDKWIEKEILSKKIKDKEVLVIYEKDQFAGWMRWGLFWDNSPFMNMLHFLPPFRQKGYGKKVVELWENEMRQKGYKLVLTSTSSIENGQYFYKKLGYREIGHFQLENEPVEIFLLKRID